jgi:hypothetical protein
MRAVRSILLLSLLLSVVNAFTTKKRERRHAFNAVNPKQESSTKQDQMAPGASPSGPLFALAPSAELAGTLSLMYEEDEEDMNISYGVAFASCVFSLALGFGFGYGT